MKIFITGGSGFLGKAIINRLADNHNILYLSSCRTNLFNHPSIQNIVGNSLNYSDNFDVIKSFGPDLVILAGWHGGNNSKNVNNLDQFHLNLPASIQLLEFLTKLPNIKQIIGLGSFAEYGSLFTIAEESDIELPVNLYGLSKLTLKKYLEFICNQNSIKWTWVRPCFIYGPNDVVTRLIPRTIIQLLNNNIVKLDNCHSIIDYLYVDDFVDFFEAIISRQLSGTYNLCSGQQFILKDIILKIGNIIGLSNNIIFDIGSSRPKGHDFVCGNNSKIIRDTGIHNKIGLVEGLNRTINFLRSERPKI